MCDARQCRAAAPVTHRVVRARRDAALHALIAEMQRLAPGVRGAAGAPAPGDITPGADNRAALARLADGTRRAHPQAGQGFWSVRSWSLLAWQPAALAVLGVHAVAIAPRLDRVGLAVGDGSAFGFRLPHHEVEHGTPAALAGIAGARLRALADALIADLARVIPVKRRLALRLLADRVLGTLALVRANRADLCADDTLALGERWLRAMALEGESGLSVLTLGDGRRQAVLDRRACCLEYRIAPGTPCASCPKHAREARRERMRRDWEARVRAR